MIDTAKIKVKAGSGGDGIVSFRREKYISKGGPWGGDGGTGGDIVFKVDHHANTLTKFRRKRTFEAESGKPGMKKLKKGDLLNIPIAHHDGNYYIDDSGLRELEENGQILLRYTDADGNIKNPNGSVESIAGVCNKEKNIFGLMPHPERAMEAVLGSDDGVAMLKGFLES